MNSVSRKISLLGNFAVGKTSVVARSVRNTFSERYLSSVGVKVDSKTIALHAAREVRLVLWDIAGANLLDQIRANYVAGSQGLMLVADGTRSHTVQAALDLHKDVCQLLRVDLPSVLLLNKCDLADEWQVPPERIRELESRMPVFTTSARTGEGVEEAFRTLAAGVEP